MNFPSFTLRMVSTFLSISLILSACGSPKIAPVEKTDSRLKVLATTTLVADVVKNVGGDKITSNTLLPIGVDPHSFQPAPQDVAKLAEAELVFANGAGLEEFLKPMMENANAEEKTVFVSEGITLLQSAEEPDAEEHHHDEGDPHVWFDPNNVVVWTENIVSALSQKDPANAAFYRKNGDTYIEKLKQLDEWIRQQVAAIPPQNRLLVTDHVVFTYFAERYGFTQIGAILPGFSTLSEPSAQEIAALEDSIHRYQIKAIFVGRTVNPALAERIAEDTGVQLVSFYTGSLSAPGGEAETYLQFMQYNVNAIVQALK